MLSLGIGFIIGAASVGYFNLRRRRKRDKKQK
jgi:hypothetical protein